MRGADQPQTTMFSYVSVEDRIPADHPLRAIHALVQPILTALSPRFDAIYATRMGRPSIPPERLLRALLLQVLFTIRSERQLMEQLNDNLLFRWFVGLNPDDAVWVPTVFSKHRDRLIEGNIADAFMQEVLKAADARALLSHEHFTVDGTLLEAWASHKSFRPKDDPSLPPSNGEHHWASGQCADGQSPWPDRRHRCARAWLRRGTRRGTRRGPGDVDEARTPHTTPYAGCRQRLRHRRLGRGRSRVRGDAACGTAHPREQIHERD